MGFTDTGYLAQLVEIMKTIRSLNFKDRFFWKGQKYMQVLRPKKPESNKFYVVCAPLPQGEWLDMPAGRKVKPIIRI
uniref:hypothetical protein n=1 Tax=Ningiella ruwaisensis TaxID=2364274 RepID=UPI00109EF31C|nr:hypothetical protein [Ningiella ruwaisensis]